MADQERIINAGLSPSFTEKFGKDARRGRTLLDLSVPGRRCAVLPKVETPMSDLIPDEFLRREPALLPETSEGELVSYFTGLSQDNFSIGTGDLYPLGSCTMKYNPLRNDNGANNPGFTDAHPAQPEETVQGSMQVLYELQKYMTEITGMAGASLTPMSGAHGELAGVEMIRAYHDSRSDTIRTKMLVPEAAHGTNPASAAMAGFQIISLKTNKEGDVDQEDLDEKLRQFKGQIAGMMLTYPSTLGLPDKSILQIIKKVHDDGGLMYADGANTNAIMGRVRFGDLGFDVAHVNTHKALSTPHGGGGPGAGPVVVGEKLVDFLPGPIVSKVGEDYRWVQPERSIGRMGKWQGNFGVLDRALSYILTMGEEGLREVSGTAVLLANYVRVGLSGRYKVKYGADRPCMHEAVLDGTRQKKRGVNTLAIAKRLQDYGFHPPTIYFPHDPEEAIMIEPTETATKESVDAFVAAMVAIDKETLTDPDVVLEAPHFTPVRKVNEAAAAHPKTMYLRWKPAEETLA